MELLLVEDMENISVIGRSLDITCGQLIDRIGVKLGYQFPAGAYVEKAASGGVLTDVPQICLKGLDCCMSGFENKADALISSGAEPGTVCLYTLEAVRRTVSAMVAQARSLMGDLPCLFVGGVMSDVYVKDGLSVLGNVFFAAPELSGDNAVGIAYLAGLRHEGGIR